MATTTKGRGRPKIYGKRTPLTVRLRVEDRKTVEDLRDSIDPSISLHLLVSKMVAYCIQKIEEGKIRTLDLFEKNGKD